MSQITMKDFYPPVPENRRPTIAELEAILNRENGWEDQEIEILPNGEIIAKGGAPTNVKPLTMKENLGGEYGAMPVFPDRWPQDYI